MKKQRVKDAISHIQPDFCPHNIELTSTLSDKFCDFAGVAKADLWDWFGNHIEKANYNKGFLNDDHIYEDEFGVKWDRSGIDKDIGIIKEYIFKEPQIMGHAFPDPDLKNVEFQTLELLNNGNDSFKLGKIGFSLFERSWSMRGFENFLMDLMVEESFAEELLDNVLDYNMRIIDKAIGFDIDGFFFGDDYGQQRGLLMSPQVWRKMIKPRLAVMFGKVKSSGKAVMLHSCGNISEIMGDLIDIGLDVYQTFQPEIYDMKKIKTEYGADLAFWGGISTQQVLPYVSPDELKKIVKETIGIMNVNGGFIVAPTHQVPADVPVENIFALAEIFKNQ
ncbi:MAG: uroporphyrinogen decarboxylase family protein [Saccharofermentanales bacterium]